MKTKFYKIKMAQAGMASLFAVLFFLTISLVVMSSAAIPTSNQTQGVQDLNKAKKAYIAADSVDDEMYYRLNQGRTLPASVTLPFASSSASASVSTSNGITSAVTTGTNGSITRYAQSSFEQSAGTSFSYGMQVGTGGIQIQGGSTINGSVYSAGDIIGDTAVNYITGSATAANQSNPVANQSNSYTNGTTPLSVLFGNTSATQDAAETFQVSTTTALTSVRLYIKKVGAPSDATIRIIKDNGSGKPGATTLATGTLSASTVTTSFGYVTIPVSPTPSLLLASTYWIVIDYTTQSSSNYYILAATNSTYAYGSAKTGTYSTSNSSNVWTGTVPSGADLYFDVFVGGNTSVIQGGSQYSRLNIGGTAWADEVDNSSVTGTAYCQTGVYLYNQSNVSKVCDVSRADPTPLAYPISDGNITDWKATAAAGGTITGNVSVGGGISSTTPARKIVGNLSVGGGATLNLTGPLWVTGNILLSGGGIIKLASSVGTADGVIIADGTINVGGGAHFDGSGTTGSYLVAITTNTAATNAVSISGGSGSVVLFAPYGGAWIEGGASAKSVVANAIHIEGGSTINYDSGLTGIDFVNGPSGSWKVDSWSEVSQ